MAKTSKKQRRFTLTIYAMKASIEASHDAIKPNSNLEYEALDLGDGVEADLYVLPAFTKPPPWSKLFEGVVDFNKLGIKSSNAAAVLIVPAAGRLFALTFGFGRHLMRPGVWEERFGLKVTLNSIDPKSIRSIDRKSFESLGRQVQEQATRPAEATEFGLDIEQDVLRAVTGTPRDATFGSRLHGKDSLVANVQFGLEGIVAYLGDCHEFAKDDSYKRDFPWVDHIAEISDAALRDSLDRKLIARVRTQKLDRLWLAIPEQIDWARVDGFKFSESKRVDTVPDLQFSDLLKQLPDPSAVTLKQLKTKKALCYAHDHDFPIHKWSAYQCTCFEVDKEDDTYLLSAGKWYRVASSFVQEVNSFVEGIPAASVSLPDCEDVGEGQYNRKVYETDKTFFSLLDDKLISYGGGHSKIEVCDLMTADRELIHVKKYGGSSVLSHLFAQAAVAGELLLTDADFRKEANKLLPKSKRLPRAFRPADYEVVIAIITWSKKKLTLPFFSRVNLRAATKRLRGFGYKVSLATIAGPRPST